MRVRMGGVKFFDPEEIVGTLLNYVRLKNGKVWNLKRIAMCVKEPEMKCDMEEKKLNKNALWLDEEMIECSNKQNTTADDGVDNNQRVSGEVVVEGDHGRETTVGDNAQRVEGSAEPSRELDD
ncbi:hypothetical protein NDU88_003677 [Pleurodeles waltl]|uniref:Uncharacterized protein n=1 Tax=Pleurodeles waltl TaxID=8319 RepID=A0AAV7W6U6_PLEWA|nr:hypothetical protein NDU88_003676 [Pleurodeles waltl]KAJ1208291.1 hypothetical protein NDU88_003677 [Pleurodeles waltl]